MRVLLVDDHPLFLEGLQYLLTTHGIEIVGTAGDGSEALLKARTLKPDIILMDIRMPGGGGIEAICPIKAEMPQVKIVMLTTFSDDENLFEAIKRGASGYLLKNMNAEELVTLLQELEQGEAPLSPGLASRLLQEFARDKSAEKVEPATHTSPEKDVLTLQQARILNLVADGKIYKEVAVTLRLSERTVKYHMARILERLHLENRSQAIAYAAREKDKEDKGASNT